MDFSLLSLIVHYISNTLVPLSLRTLAVNLEIASIYEEMQKMSATKGIVGSAFESVLQHQTLPRKPLFASRRQYHLL
jgi:hypothetical protein